ncbi:MAG TPA: right-handed parallel beta-helix repeat-containing protein [archaeon]|nr:right-handed parallel beta-helix repeat-containing protein [archaeon]
MRLSNALLAATFILFALYQQEALATDISACTNLNSAGTTYNLTASISNQGGRACMNITANNVVLDCGGYTIDGADTSSSRGVNVSRAINATVRNCILNDWYDGIYIGATNNSLFENNSITSGTNSGIWTETASFNNTIIRNNASGVTSYGYYAVTTGGANNNTFIGNNATSPGSYGFYFSSNNITAIGNNITAATTSGFYNSGSTNTTLINNTVHHQGTYGIYSTSITSALYSGNNVTRATTAGFYFTSVTTSVVRENYFYSNAAGMQIENQANPSNFTNNTFVNNSQYALYFPYTSGVTITNLMFANNSITTNATPGQQGFYFESTSAVAATYRINVSTDNTIDGLPMLYVNAPSVCPNNTEYTNGSSYSVMGFVGCRNITIRDSAPTHHLLFAFVDNSTVEGLNISARRIAFSIQGQSRFNNFTNNVAKNNTLYGFYLLGTTNSYARNNTFYNNSLIENTQDGFRITAAPNNTFIGNNASRNQQYGFNIVSGSNNNTFINNTGLNDVPSSALLLISSNFNRFMGNSFFVNYQYGFYISSSNNNSFLNNTINRTSTTYTTYSLYTTSGDYNEMFYNIMNTTNGVYLDSNSNGNTIRNNTATTCSTGYTAASTGTFNNTFTDNMAERCSTGYSISVSTFRHNTTLINNTALRATSTGISVSASNMTIANNTVIDATTYGISSSGTNNTVEYNTLTNSLSTSPVAIYSAGTGVTNIRYNSMDNFTYGVYLASTARNNSVANNNITNATTYGIFFTNTWNNTAVNNTITTTSGTTYGIYLASTVVDNILLNNTIRARGQTGIYLTAAFNNTVENNTVSGAQYGIYTASSGVKNRFINNNASLNTLYGFYLNTPNNTFINNTAANNTQYGFYLSSSTRNNFTENLAYENLIDGITMTSSSDVNNFTNNSAYNNARWDVSISSSSNNTFTDLWVGLGSIPTLVSFNYSPSNTVNVRGVPNPPTDPTDPTGYDLKNIQRYVNITSSTANSWLNATISYAGANLHSATENDIIMSRYTTSWTTTTSSFANNVSINAESDLYSANITTSSTSGIYALLANLSLTPLFPLKDIYWSRTYQSDLSIRSHFANRENVSIRANISNFTSLDIKNPPQIDITAPNGTKMIVSQNMTNESLPSSSPIFYGFNYTIDSNNAGWWNVSIVASRNISHNYLFYQGDLWNTTTTWRNSTGSVFPFRINTTLRELNQTDRYWYLVDRYYNFTFNNASSAHNGSIRVTYSNGSHYIEIPSQLHNITQDSNGLVSAANLAFLISMSKAATQDLSIYFARSDLGAVSYPTDLAYGNLSLNITNISTVNYILQFNRSAGGVFFDLFNSTHNLTSNRPIQNSPEAKFASASTPCNIKDVPSPNFYSVTGPIFIRYSAYAQLGSCAIDYVKNYTIYSHTDYFQDETNISTTYGSTQSWDYYTDHEMRLSPSAYMNVSWRNSTSVPIDRYPLVRGGSTLSVGDVSWIMFSHNNSGSLIGDIYLSRIETTATSPTSAIFDDSNIAWWRRRPIATAIGVAPSNAFYAKVAKVMSPSAKDDIELMNRTHYNLIAPVNLSASSAETFDTVPPLYVAGLFNNTPLNPNDNQNVTCYSFWTDNLEIDYGIVSHNASGTATNVTVSITNNESSWINYTIDAATLEAGNAYCVVNAYDIGGNGNSTITWYFTANDVTPPRIDNITNAPNSSAALDPGVSIEISANISDFTAVSSAILQYNQANLTSGNTNWTNATMERNTTTLIANVSFTPSVANNWTYRIVANDTLGNTNVSSAANISIEYDRTWSLTPSSWSESSGGAGSSSVNVVNLLVNNTGDFDLTFSVSHNYDSDRFTLNVSTPIIVSSNNGTGIAVSLTPQAVPATNDVTISVTSLNTTSSTNPQTSTGTFITYANGSYLYVTMPVINTTATVGGSFQISARSRNVGNDTATNAWISYSLPSQWTSSDALNATVGNLAPGEIGWNNITVTVGSSASAGDQTVFVSSNSSTGGYGNRSATVNVIGTTTTTITTTTTTASTVAPPSGGGGGGGGLSAAQKTKLIQTEQVYEIVGGGDQSFLFRVTNPFNGTLRDVKVSVAGFLSQYISITPSVLSSLGIGESYDFVVSIKAPEYFTRGNYNLTFTIRGSANETKTSGNTTYTELMNLLEDKKVLLGVHEISRSETLDLMNKSVDWIEEMRDAGLNAVFAERLFNSSQNLLLLRSYEEIRDNALQIETIKNNGFKAQKLLGELESAIQLSERNGVFVTETPRIISLAKVAFLEGDFSTALQHLESAQLTFALETKGELNPVYFLLNNWQQVLLAGLFGGVLLFLGAMRFRIYILDRNLGLLAGEEGVLLGLMKQLQKESFEQKKMSMEEYLTAMQQYENRLSEAVQRIVEYETLRSSIFRLRRTTDRLKDERDRLYDLMTKTQSQYLERKMIETHIYQNKMRSFATRLSEVEEMLAFKEAQRAIREAKSAVWRAYYKLW